MDKTKTEQQTETQVRKPRLEDSFGGTVEKDIPENDHQYCHEGPTDTGYFKKYSRSDKENKYH